jgi:hypothetical protein
MNEDIFAIQFFLVFLGIFLFFSALYAFGTYKKTTFVVKEKGTLTNGYVNNGRGSTYTNFMIYTKDGRAFKNVNCLWFWKWRSTELQAQMKVGKKYVAEIYGWRIGGINVYPNIVRVKEVKNQPKKRR